MAKPVIAVDVDDVLADFHGHFARICRDQFGYELLQPDRAYMYLGELGAAKEVELAAVDAVYDCELFQVDMPLVECVDAVHRLATVADLVAITARTSRCQIFTDPWIAAHFAGCFSESIYISHSGRGDHTRKKQDVFRELEIAAAIDDAPHNLAGCADMGAQGFLIDRGWNRHFEETPDFVRVLDWQPILDHFGLTEELAS